MLAFGIQNPVGNLAVRTSLNSAEMKKKGFLSCDIVETLLCLTLCDVSGELCSVRYWSLTESPRRGCG